MGCAGRAAGGWGVRAARTAGGAGGGDVYAGQGNLGRERLFVPGPALEKAVRFIVAEGAQAPGHMFNLGHGVLPDTDPEVLTRVVELVHEVSAR